MSRAADVVVVGGGVVGASTAFHLTKAGVTKVTLLERRYLGAGASGKSGALVRMHYTNPHDGALAAQSLPYFLHWNDMVGAGDPGYVKTGVLWLAGDADAEKLRLQCRDVAQRRGKHHRRDTGPDQHDRPRIERR